MSTHTLKIVTRSAAVLALASAMALGSATLASAQGWNGGNCASPRVSSFDYSAGGTGGRVTAVTSTSVTVDSWNGTSTTYTIGTSTTVTEGGQPATLSDLVVGDRVQIQTASGDPTTATSINIELAELFGTVSSVSGDTILITDFQGFTRTILVSGSTTYTQDGAAATLSDVTNGVKIRAAGTVDPNGTTLDALTISIGGNAAGQTEIIKGVVTGVTSSSVTVLTTAGTSTTFTYTTATTFSEDGATVTSTALANGERVDILVNTSADTTALTVRICLSHLEGVVTGVSGNDITVLTHGGFTPTIIVSTATTYTEGGTAATLSSVTTGEYVKASGTVDANGTSLDALTVAIYSSEAAAQGSNQGGQGQGGSFGGLFGGGWGNGNNGGNNGGNNSGSSGQLRAHVDSSVSGSGRDSGFGFGFHGRFGHGHGRRF